jgi:hypothetical protein
VVPFVIKAMKKASKDRENAELKQRDPEKWMRLQEMEHERQMMQHQKRMMTHDGMKTGIGLILRFLTKK